MDGCGYGGASTGAAREGWTGTAFPDMECKGVGGAYRCEACVDAAGERGMGGNAQAEAMNHVGSVWRKQNSMGVTDRNKRQEQGLVVEWQVVACRGLDEADLDRDLCAIGCRQSFEGAGVESGVRLDEERGWEMCWGKEGSEVEGDAAQSVAASFGAGAVGVVDDHACGLRGRQVNQKDAVGSDACMAIAEQANTFGGWRDREGGSVEEKKIVSQSVVLGEGGGGRDVHRH